MYIDMIQKGEAKEFEGKKIGSTWTEGLKEETKELQKESTENAHQIIDKMSEVEMLKQSLNMNTSGEKTSNKKNFI